MRLSLLCDPESSEEETYRDKNADIYSEERNTRSPKQYKKKHKPKGNGMKKSKKVSPLF